MTTEEKKSPTVTNILEDIETNLWLAEAYMLRNSLDLAKECLNEAWKSYTAHTDILADSIGIEADFLGDKIYEKMIGWSREKNKTFIY